MKYEIDIEEAKRYFRRIYPEINHISIVGENKDKSGIVIFVGDGYHVINERIVSEFYKDKDTAMNSSI